MGKSSLHIGITGGIGTGKSVVCKILEVLGYPVFYADNEAKKLMVEDVDLVAAIKRTFGNEAYYATGELNRTYISNHVFSDGDKLKELNGLVHPATIRAYERWKERQTSILTFKEAALLFETGTYKFSDYTILVVSPLDIRVKRVMDRDHLAEQAVLARIEKQWKDEEKLKLANFVIENDEQQALLPQVLEIEKILLTLIS